MPVGDGVLDVPTAARRQFGMRINLPIEVKFSRRVVGDADPYDDLLQQKGLPFPGVLGAYGENYLAALTRSAVS